MKSKKSKKPLLIGKGFFLLFLRSLVMINNSMTVKGENLSYKKQLHNSYFTGRARGFELIEAVAKSMYEKSKGKAVSIEVLMGSISSILEIINIHQLNLEEKNTKFNMKGIYYMDKKNLVGQKESIVMVLNFLESKIKK